MNFSLKALNLLIIYARFYYNGYSSLASTWFQTKVKYESWNNIALIKGGKNSPIIKPYKNQMKIVWSSDGSRNWNSYPVSPNSAFIHMLVYQHISANHNFFHLGIFRYIEICLTKVSFFQLCLLWDQNQFHVAVCLVYGLQWFWHLTFGRNWFMNVAPFNYIIRFCSSFSLFNLTDCLSVGYKKPSK